MSPLLLDQLCEWSDSWKPQSYPLEMKQFFNTREQEV